MEERRGNGKWSIKDPQHLHLVLCTAGLSLHNLMPSLQIWEVWEYYKETCFELEREVSSILEKSLKVL